MGICISISEELATCIFRVVQEFWIGAYSGQKFEKRLKHILCPVHFLYNSCGVGDK
jgi:hypothetical protein